MLMKRMGLAIGVAMALATPQASADSISFLRARRVVTAQESGGLDAAPVDGRVLSFFVTTDSDILSIMRVKVTTDLPLFLSAYGANVGPALPSIVEAIPSAGADSYIDTPGDFHALGSVDLPGDGSVDAAWGDVNNSGAQVDFKFAQLTVPKGADWEFYGEVNIESSTGGVYSQSFWFSAPEPASFQLTGVALLAFAHLRRRAA